MIQHLREGQDLDRRVHSALHGSPLADDEQVPTYSTDGVVIFDALRAALGPVDVSRTDRGCRRHLPYRYEVTQEGRKLLWADGKTEALALCSLALSLAALRAAKRPVPDMATALYWFRPARGVFFEPNSSFPPFCFSTSEPFPVFVKSGKGETTAIGMGCPLDWPEYPVDGGAYAVAVDRLPGEFGPRIEPPKAWHADFDPERLDMWLDPWDDANEGEE